MKYTRNIFKSYLLAIVETARLNNQTQSLYIKELDCRTGRRKLRTVQMYVLYAYCGFHISESTVSISFRFATKEL
jgi:hypothetical protein